MNSVSSSLMYGITLYRNQPGVLNKLAAQPAYALIALVAAVEAAVTFAFTILSLAMRPFSSAPLSHSIKWFGSSVFTFGWSVTDFFLNLFVFVLIADERSARVVFSSGNIMVFPQDAHIQFQN